jgi:hypothetical protein
MPDIATWDVLQEFGFTADSSIFSNLRPGLNYDFGNFTLCASLVMNTRLVDVVLFTGVSGSGFSATEVVFELPRIVESREQCAALLAWNLDNHASSRVFHPIQPPTWLYDGRKHKHLLPWVREAEEYRARPHYTVERDWLKLALKSLARHLTKVEDNEPVEVSFDGKVLSFRVAGNVVVLAAVGSPWTSSFSLPAGKLRRLPKRLMNAHVDVSVWRSWLNIDRWRYDGIVEPEELPKQQEDS